MRTRLVPFGCVLALALAGCGDDGDSGASESATTPPPSTTPAPKPDPELAKEDKRIREEAEKNPPTGSVTFARRGGKTIAKVKSERVGRQFCKQLRADGRTGVGGEPVLTIATPDGDLRCDLSKRSGS